MALFYYQALERNGRKTKGMIEADSARHARQLLRGKELIPVHIEARMTRQQININTLDVTQSVILEALFDPWLSPVQARALLQQRPAKGWEDVDQFLAQPLLADVDERTKKQLKTVLSVDSNYFWLRSDITVNEIELTMNSLIVRMGPQHFSVLWHQTGESE